MKQNLINYVPKSKRTAIKDIYKDDDGYWICLNAGWNATNSDAESTIHEDTIKDLLYQISGIKKQEM